MWHWEYHTLRERYGNQAVIVGVGKSKLMFSFKASYEYFTGTFALKALYQKNEHDFMTVYVL